MSVRRLIAATLVAVATFASLMAPWPGWSSCYAALFRFAAEAGCALVPIPVKVAPNSGKRAVRFDTVLIANEGVSSWRLKLDSREVGLLPTAAFVAGCAGAALITRPRWTRLVGACMAVQAGVQVHVLVWFLHGWTLHARDPGCPASHPEVLGTAAWRATIATLVELGAASAVYLLLPLLIGAWPSCAARARR